MIRGVKTPLEGVAKIYVIKTNTQYGYPVIHNILIFTNSQSVLYIDYKHRILYYIENRNTIITRKYLYNLTILLIENFCTTFIYNTLWGI